MRPAAPLPPPATSPAGRPFHAGGSMRSNDEIAAALLNRDEGLPPDARWGVEFLSESRHARHVPDCQGKPKLCARCAADRALHDAVTMTFFLYAETRRGHA